MSTLKIKPFLVNYLVVCYKLGSSECCLIWTEEGSTWDGHDPFAGYDPLAEKQMHTTVSIAIGNDSCNVMLSKQQELWSEVEDENYKTAGIRNGRLKWSESQYCGHTDG